MGEKRPTVRRSIGQIGSIEKLIPETGSPMTDASYSHFQARWVTTGAVCESDPSRVLYESLRGCVTLLVGDFADYCR